MDEAPAADRRGDDRPVRFALTGAGGQYARTLLAQSRVSQECTPSVLCDLDLSGVRETCRALGIADSALQECRSRDEVATAAGAGRTALVTDGDLLDPRAFDVLVEATGVVGPSVRMALDAVRSGRHLVLVSKETESVAGPYLARVATEHGVVSATPDGDQPANLLDLLGWAENLGLGVVAAGKSAEYDVVHDHATGRARHLGTEVDAPEIDATWHLGDDVVGGLARRRRALAGLPLSGAADYCEMAVVANRSRLLPDVPGLHRPVARVSELADVYALRSDGGVLEHDAALDVFTALRRPDEASFAGGVFVVVRCADPVTWQVLADKGHVVSRDRRYACVYRPYHLMGIETVGTIVRAARGGASAGRPLPERAVVMTGRTATALVAGHELRDTGHHHDIDDVTPELLPASAGEAVGAAPFYLVGGARLRRDVPAGHTIGLEDLDGVDPALLSAWEAVPPPPDASSVARTTRREGAV